MKHKVATGVEREVRTKLSCCKRGLSIPAPSGLIHAGKRMGLRVTFRRADAAVETTKNRVVTLRPSGPQALPAGTWGTTGETFLRVLRSTLGSALGAIDALLSLSRPFAAVSPFVCSPPGSPPIPRTPSRSAPRSWECTPDYSGRRPQIRAATSTLWIWVAPSSQPTESPGSWRSRGRRMNVFTCYRPPLVFHTVRFKTSQLFVGVQLR